MFRLQPTDQERFDGYTNYRAYFFGNMYLSSIQQGIQALHVTSELFLKFPDNDFRGNVLRRWANLDKTVVLLNGGYAETINTIYEALQDVCPFPFAKFHEEKEALNCATTSVGVILPEQVWDFDSAILGSFSDLTDEEAMSWNIKCLLDKAPLAS